MGAPRQLFPVDAFRTNGFRGYDVSPDGRFLFRRLGSVAGADGSAPVGRLILTEHFSTELERLVPTD